MAPREGGRASVTGGFPSQDTGIAELWCFVCQPKHITEQTVQIRMNRDALMRIRCHSSCLCAVHPRVGDIYQAPSVTELPTGIKIIYGGQNMFTVIIMVWNKYKWHFWLCNMPISIDVLPFNKTNIFVNIRVKMGYLARGGACRRDRRGYRTILPDPHWFWPPWPSPMLSRGTAAQRPGFENGGHLRKLLRTQPLLFVPILDAPTNANIKRTIDMFMCSAG